MCNYKHLDSLSILIVDFAYVYVLHIAINTDKFHFPSEAGDQ